MFESMTTHHCYIDWFGEVQCVLDLTERGWWWLWWCLYVGGIVAVIIWNFVVPKKEGKNDE